MIPGEIIPKPGEIELNVDRPILKLTIANTGDRPIQVGSHYHFYEVNAALRFEREPTKGMRLDIPAGTAVRFEPGDEKQVQLVALAGSREIYGFNAQIEGRLDWGKLQSSDRWGSSYYERLWTSYRDRSKRYKSMVKLASGSGNGSIVTSNRSPMAVS